ncbi:MAG: hypothetical protein ACQ9MH_24370 [Nitrospinales bacterium]
MGVKIRKNKRQRYLLGVCSPGWPPPVIEGWLASQSRCTQSAP